MPLNGRHITIRTLQFVMSREPLRIAVSLTFTAGRLRCVACDGRKQKNDRRSRESLEVAFEACGHRAGRCQRLNLERAPTKFGGAYPPPPVGFRAAVVFDQDRYPFAEELPIRFRSAPALSSVRSN